jgi:hypothetical protein
MRACARTGLVLFALVATAAGVPARAARAQSDTGMHGGAMKDGAMKDGAMKDGAMKDGAMGMGHGAMFMKATKLVMGSCMVGEDQGQHVLTFSDDFSIENSPTPYVALTTTTGGLGDSPVWVGAVQHAKGAQRYVIPKGTDLARYTHVVIWDKKTKTALATAELTSGGAMSGGAMSGM